ncbi:unnamed protein product [Phytomonas sp. Hart1]|nr:unnamed protein product [Phytomonas sp. Hart1]|eukprot:CCW68018.1 unnamed protein product [Phytomonas sp. isolate Hart1]
MRSFEKSILHSEGKRVRPKLLYDLDFTKIPTPLYNLFQKSLCDAETDVFIQSASKFSVWKLLIANICSSVVSRTTANGLVGRGGMFVLSTAQAHSLLRSPAAPRSGDVDHAPSSRLSNEPIFKTLLDIGAGDGGVTAKLSPLFEKVFVTEYSATMRWRLKRHGYEVLSHEDPFHDEKTKKRRLYDVISCMNVLDRADTPLTLLREMRESLNTGGLLLLAVVLPWCPFVEYNNKKQEPKEQLPMAGGECRNGASFEMSMSKLVENVLQPCGFEVVRWTRVPYLCEGNFELEYSTLSDAVFVLRRSVPSEGDISLSNDL